MYGSELLNPATRPSYDTELVFVILFWFTNLRFNRVFASKCQRQVVDEKIEFVVEFDLDVVHVVVVLQREEPAACAW